MLSFDQVQLSCSSPIIAVARSLWSLGRLGDWYSVELPGVGGSFGANVFASFMTLHLDRLCGDFDLDDVPHATNLGCLSVISICGVCLIRLRPSLTMTHCNWPQPPKACHFNLLKMRQQKRKTSTIYTSQQGTHTTTNLTRKIRTTMTRRAMTIRARGRRGP